MEPSTNSEPHNAPSEATPVRRHLRLAASFASEKEGPERSGGSPEDLGRVGPYVLLEKLATGGMAEIFLARHDGPNGHSKKLVIKRILPHLAEDPQFLKMFLNEARVVALLDHPNLVSVHEAGTGPTYFIAMEHLDGPDLLRLGRSANDPRHLQVWARIIADACAGLHYAHELQSVAGEPLHIVHRDVSLENIVVTYDGRVKVLDFGIAKADCIEGRTEPGHVKGKFAYLAPEQFLGAHADRRADIWALGVCLYRLCSGVRPFAGRNMAEMVQRVVSQDPPALHLVAKDVPEELSRIVHKALKKRPEHRYATAAEMQSDLLAWVRGRGGVTSRDLAQFVERHVPPSGLTRRAHDARSNSLPGAPPMSEDIHLDWAEAVSVSEVAPVVEPPEPALPGRRLAAWFAEMCVAVIALRYTYGSFFPGAFLVLLLASAATLATKRATLGEWALGLALTTPVRQGEGGGSVLFRGALRVLLQHGWLVLFAWFLKAAYGAHPFSDLIGIGALGCFLASAIGSVPACMGERRTLHDLVSGLEVVRSRR